MLHAQLAQSVLVVTHWCRDWDTGTLLMTQKPWLHAPILQHVKEKELLYWLVKTPTMPQDKLTRNNRYAIACMASTTLLIFISCVGNLPVPSISA